MGKVVQFDREMAKLFSNLEKLKSQRVQGIAVVVRKDDETEEFYFCGSPVSIYQALSLAQAHILQSFSLMDDCGADRLNKLDDEDE